MGSFKDFRPSLVVCHEEEFGEVHARLRQAIIELRPICDLTHDNAQRISEEAAFVAQAMDRLSPSKSYFMKLSDASKLLSQQATRLWFGTIQVSDAIKAVEATQLDDQPASEMLGQIGRMMKVLEITQEFANHVRPLLDILIDVAHSKIQHESEQMIELVMKMVGQLSEKVREQVHATGLQLGGPHNSDRSQFFCSNTEGEG